MNLPALVLALEELEDAGAALERATVRHQNAASAVIAELAKIRAKGPTAVAEIVGRGSSSSACPVDSSGDCPNRRQLADYVRKETEAGRMKLGDKRPASTAPAPVESERHEIFEPSEGRKKSRLTRYGVAVMKRDLLAGDSPRTVAERYGVNRFTVYNLKNGKAWKDVAPLPPVAREPDERTDPTEKPSPF